MIVAWTGGYIIINSTHMIDFASSFVL
jgi:hypothetical protein